MIILHLSSARNSREFVDKYGNENTVITYPDFLGLYSVSACPSVVINEPSYYDETLEKNIEEIITIYRCPDESNWQGAEAFMDEVLAYQGYVNERATNSPPR